MNMMTRMIVTWLAIDNYNYVLPIATYHLLPSHFLMIY